MAEKQLVKKAEGEVIQPGAMVVNQIVIRNVDRTSKDINTWRSSHIAAENVYYPNRTRLYDLYDDISLDGHLTGIIEKRMAAVLNKNLHFEIADKRVDEMDDLIESNEFRKLVTLILLSKLWGISGVEFIPGKEFRYEEIQRKHIKPENGVIAIEQTEINGIDYTGLDNIWVIGEKKDYGLLLKCAPYALWKRGDMADWAQYVEIFGQPVRVMKYDAYDLKTKMELKQVVDESGSSLAMLIPKQVDFEMMDGKQSNGDGSLQEKLKNACNEEMSVIILGNTESTTSSKSSGYAQSKEHGKQQLEVSKSDLKLVTNMLNCDHFLNILASYGFKVAGGRFKYEKEIDLDYLKTKMEVDKEVAGQVPVSDDYWYETYGVPKPDNYDELKAEKEAQRQAAPPAPDPAEPDDDDPAPGKKKPARAKPVARKKAEQPAQLGFFARLRTELADFFDPAP
jgi:hypothetical protein